MKIENFIIIQDTMVISKSFRFYKILLTLKASGVGKPQHSNAIGGDWRINAYNHIIIRTDTSMFI